MWVHYVTLVTLAIHLRVLASENAGILEQTRLLVLAASFSYVFYNMHQKIFDVSKTLMILDLITKFVLGPYSVY